jgi:hypothetical protein
MVEKSSTPPAAPGDEEEGARGTPPDPARIQKKDDKSEDPEDSNGQDQKPKPRRTSHTTSRESAGQGTIRSNKRRHAM